MSRFKKDLGQVGENIARNYLASMGYMVIDKNFTIRGGELDLVAYKHEIYCFIEVKTRIKDDFFLPEDSIGANKKRHLKRTARIWLYRNRVYDVFWQIDVISIILSKDKKLIRLKHYANAIY